MISSGQSPGTWTGGCLVGLLLHGNVPSGTWTGGYLVGLLLHGNVPSAALGHLRINHTFKSLSKPAL